jgi:hypothetical protein
MASLIDIRDRGGRIVAQFQDGVGIVLNETQMCGLRFDLKEYIKDFNAQAAITDWHNNTQRKALIAYGKQLIQDFCTTYDITFNEIL